MRRKPGEGIALQERSGVRVIPARAQVDQPRARILQFAREAERREHAGIGGHAPGVVLLRGNRAALIVQCLARTAQGVLHFPRARAVTDGGEAVAAI